MSHFPTSDELVQVGAGRRPWAHQVSTFEWAKNRHQAAYFLTMGLGKTAVALNVTEYHRRAGRLKTTLVVAPLSVLDSWAEELERCYPGTRVLHLPSLSSKAARQKALCKFYDEPSYILINYESVMALEMELDKALRMHGPYAIICDESTSIKNPRAQRTKAMLRLGEAAAYRYLLTGTPVPQGPEDIFGQYLFLDRTVFGSSFVVFRNNWLRLGGYLHKQIMGLRPGLEAPFNELVYKLAIRYTKEECLDMPPKVYQTRHYELGEEEAAAYASMAKEWVAEVKGGLISATNGLTKSLRLAQICTGFAGTLVDCETVELDLKDKSKLRALKELLEELEGKFIIWCAWRKNVKECMALCKALSIKAVDYYGETEDRRANEMAFRNDDSVRAFVGTGASGGAGLNLQGPDVKTVIYFSQDYSVFKRQQSEDRAHRGGITHTVTVVDLVAKKTIEEAVVRALRSGQALQDYILQKPEEFVGRSV
jgi:SNF2 family DNA or RNA helicase